MTTQRAIAAALMAVLLTACDRDAVQEIGGPAPGSYIKFFNFGVNAPQVNFYANDAKVTAIQSTTGTESTLGVAYGAVGGGGFYSALDPGQYTLTGRISATADKDLAIATVNTTLEDGKRYSYYMSGFYSTTTKTVDAFVVADEFPQEIDHSVALVRFVNAISNASPMTLYAKSTATSAETSIGTSVAYKSGGTFAVVQPGVYDLSTRLAGQTTNAIARTAVSFSGGRVYTISARGDMTVTSTTATTRPFLDNTTNR
ncbi:MAG TPA: DUF4397 domain-containing protein [Gemmatimonadaceae bacterium]|nr:DUF4397 domain-containing protein [Gemmatimonadaceae bacterium]